MPHDTSSIAAPRREPFFDPLAAPAEARHAHRLLALLRAQDGSTTRLCETIAGTVPSVRMWHQQLVSDVPPPVREILPGTRWLERTTSLVAHGEVMTDNLVYVAPDALADELRGALDEGRVPIGHLLSRLWVRRRTVADAALLQQRLWRLVGLPEAAATRSYLITTPDGPCMVVTETFRRGMLMEHAAAGAAAGR